MSSRPSSCSGRLHERDQVKRRSARAPAGRLEKDLQASVVFTRPMLIKSDILQKLMAN